VRIRRIGHDAEHVAVAGHDHVADHAHGGDHDNDNERDPLTLSLTLP
jgi:hypothetical protein